MLPADKSAQIIAALKSNSNGAQIARQIGGVSRWTVRRIAKAASIELSAGRAVKGHHRVLAEKRVQIIAALKNNPNAAEVARQVGGVSRMTVWKIAKVIGIKLQKGGLRPLDITSADNRPRTPIRRCGASVGRV